MKPRVYNLKSPFAIKINSASLSSAHVEEPLGKGFTVSLGACGSCLPQITTHTIGE
jgi:hypothetical protein